LLAVVAAVAAAPRAQDREAATVRLVGRVVSVTRDGVPAAEVWATDPGGNRVGRTVADGEGVYQLGRLPAVALRLHARAEGKVAASVAVDASGAVRAATVMLEDGEPLRGVVERADGSPVAGAAVLVSGERSAPPPFDWFEETVTDARGEWSLHAVPLRALDLLVWAPGSALLESPVPDDRAGAVRSVLAATAGAPRHVHVRGLGASQGALVRCELGTVRGQPARRLPAALCTAAVAADGTARLWPLPVDHEVRVVAAGHRSMPVYVPCRAHETRELEFLLSPLPPDALAPRTVLTGTVHDERGRPLAGARVGSRLRDRVGVPAVSDDEGAFALAVPAPAGVLCEVTLLSADHHVVEPAATTDSDGRTWAWVSAAPDRLLRLRAAAAGGVRGTLRTAGGAPLGATRIELEGRGRDARRRVVVVTATDPAGGLDVGGLPPGEYALRAVQDGAVLGTSTVDVDAGAVTAPGALAFAPAGEVCGVAVDAGGRPLRSVPVWLNAANHRVPAALRRQMQTAGGTVLLTDRDGRFRARGLAPGEWSLVCGFDAARKDAGVEERFTVDAGATAELRVTAPR
jgi:hypothetical protein